MANYSSNYPGDATWHLDTVGTHHVTSDLFKLNVHVADYNSDEQLHVGDGSNVSISHMGSSSFSTPHSTFILNKILCVPSFQMNLLSVRQLCLDNNIYFEFYSYSFCIKDRSMGTILLQGTTSNGPYSFKPSFAPPSSYTNSLSIPMWHHRLGHPSIKFI